MDDTTFRILMSPVPWWAAYALAVWAAVTFINRRYPNG